MAYEELEQFLGRGDERAVYLLSFKNVGGIVIGAMVAQQIGGLVLESGLYITLCALVGAVLGLIMTVQHQGIIVGRRLLILGKFYLSRAIRPTIIDAGTGDKPAAEDTPLLHLKDGHGRTVLRQRRVSRHRDTV